MTPMALAVAVLALAVAAEGDRDKKKDEKTCLTRRQINALSALEGHYALARVSSGRFYLLTLDESCRGLDPAFTKNLVIERSTSRVCDDGTTLVSYEETGVGTRRCRIEKIDKVASKAEALELIDARAGER
jgi:hypothetical protein